MDVSTHLIHGDAEARWDEAITPAISQGLNWSSPDGPAFAARAGEALNPHVYTRHGNPNHDQVAAIVARLEGAELALTAASGMGALTTAVLSLVRAGDHVVGQRSMYAGTTSALLNLLPGLGIECTRVEQGDVEAFAAAIRPTTKLLLLETPSNPRLQVTDLRAVAALAAERGMLTLADNTFATPLNQRPLEFGVDLVWHSATKYLGGHSDLLAGVVAGPREHIEPMWRTAQVLGAILAPFNAWLLLRGLRTLALRMDRHNANGQAVAEGLATHPAVRDVLYPGLPSHPGHAIARSQMTGFGGVLGIELAGGFEAADAFIDRLALVRRASSVGDVSSLAVHPAALFAKAMSPQQLEEAGVGPGLVRLSCGIEHRDDLVADALAGADHAGRVGR